MREEWVEEDNEKFETMCAEIVEQSTSEEFQHIMSKLEDHDAKVDDHEDLIQLMSTDVADITKQTEALVTDIHALQSEFTEDILVKYEDQQTFINDQTHKHSAMYRTFEERNKEY